MCINVVANKYKQCYRRDLLRLNTDDEYIVRYEIRDPFAMVEMGYLPVSQR